jgi:4-carboxymuconolactone decarboxylase
MDSQFEWVAHEPIALNEGLQPEVIDIVKYRKSLAKLPETEAAIVQFGREMFGKRKVSSKTFARALAVFGSKQLVNLVALMANYAATAAKLCAFSNQLAPGQKPLLPLP